MKRCPSFVIREMQTKIMRYYSMTIKMAIIFLRNKTDTETNKQTKIENSKC